ncbi:hypothetical protein C8T65DRAFT_831477 [Cerioporus squamosus]|nr:hypothetical protein C8T65DRAFT_831477 [Cerioporus squamosus]
MATPSIPLELQYLVIDLLHDDRYRLLAVTLSSCALTCRAWHRRSRCRLYHRIELGDITQRALDNLGDLISRDTEVSSAVYELHVNEDSSRGAEYSNRPGSALLVLAGKLPQLASLTIFNVPITSSLARLPVLTGFPALTTLELLAVKFSSYVAFQRMLATAPWLRRLSLNGVYLISTHISPTIHYFKLRCPPLTRLVWYHWHIRKQEDDLSLTHLLRNLDVRNSLEYLGLHDISGPLIDTIITGVISDPYTRSFAFRNLSVLRLGLVLSGSALADPSSILKSSIHLIATLWLSGAQLPQQRTFRFELVCKASTWLPVPRATPSQTSPDPTGDRPVERLLRALEDVSTELEHVLAAADWDGLRSVEFMFTDEDRHRELSKERIRDLILSLELRSRMASVFPELHRRGLLSVKFKTFDIRRQFWYDWAENSKGELEAFPSTFHALE